MANPRGPKRGTSEVLNDRRGVIGKEETPGLGGRMEAAESSSLALHCLSRKRLLMVLPDLTTHDEPWSAPLFFSSSRRVSWGVVWRGMHFVVSSLRGWSWVVPTCSQPYPGQDGEHLRNAPNSTINCGLCLGHLSAAHAPELDELVLVVPLVPLGLWPPIAAACA